MTAVVRPELQNIINPLIVFYKTGLMMAVILKPKSVAVPLRMYVMLTERKYFLFWKY